MEISGGKLFLATGSGLTIFFLKDSIPQEKASVLISSITTNSDTLTFNPIHYSQPKQLTFNSSTKSILFHLSIINYQDGIKNYRYKLGNDISWKYTNSREVKFTNLKYGDNIFLFEVQNKFGIWDSQLTQPFSIEKPFYLKNGVVIIYAIILAVLLLFLIIRIRKNKRNNKKYYSSSLSNNKYQHIQQSISDLIDIEQVYKDPEVSLKMLAEKLNCSKEHISQVINTEYKQNFNTLINNHRIEEAKSLLKKYNSKEKTVLEIAFEVGFNSKTAFNTTFKKQTGYSPTEFRKKN